MNFVFLILFLVFVINAEDLRSVEEDSMSLQILVSPYIPMVNCTIGDTDFSNYSGVSIEFMKYSFHNKQTI